MVLVTARQEAGSRYWWPKMLTERVGKQLLETKVVSDKHGFSYNYFVTGEDKKC
jgi:hypothetical protein